METQDAKLGKLLQNTKFRIGIALLVGILIGFFGGMEYKVYQIRQVMEDFSDSFGESAADEPSSVEDELASATVIDRNVGDEIILSTIKLTVNNSQESQTVGTIFSSPIVAKQGAKLVLVEVSVTNTTPSPFSFWSEGLVLVDQMNRSFTTHEDWPDEYLDGRELAPAIAERGNLLFELPEDATSYSFVVGKAGTDEVYRIKLK